MQYTVIDVCVAALLIWGVLKGIKRGLSGELSHMLSVAAIVYIGWQFHLPLGKRLAMNTQLNESTAKIAAFMALLVISWLFMLFVRFILRNIIEFAIRDKIDRFGGAVAGLIRSSVLATALLYAMSIWPHEGIRQYITETSFCGRLVARFSPKVKEGLSSRYQQLQKTQTEE